MHALHHEACPSYAAYAITIFMINIVKARETVNQQRYISTHREPIMAILSLDEQLHVTPTVILKINRLSMFSTHIFFLVAQSVYGISIIEQTNKTLTR